MSSEINQTVLQSLTEQILQTRYLLKQQARVQKGKTCEKKWFLVFGHLDAGKMALFSHEEFGLSKLLTEPNQFCQTWQSQKAVYVCLSGFVLEDENAELLPKIKKIIRKHFSKRLVDGVITVINLYQFIKQTNLQRQRMLKQYQRVFNEFSRKKTEPMPVYLLMTQLDLIAGFRTFFSNLTQEERYRTWGLSFNTEVRSDTLKTTFNQLFSQFIDNLHQTSLIRLNQVRNPEKRRLIKEFSLQMENLKNTIVTAVASLFITPPLNEGYTLRGLYFLSSQQKGKPFDSLAKTMRDSFQMELETGTPEKDDNQGYFGYQLLHHQFAEEVSTPKRKIKNGLMKLTQVALITAVIVGVMASVYRFNQDVKNINLTQLSIQNYYKHRYSVQDKERLKTILPILNHLLQINHRYQTQWGWRLLKYPFSSIAGLEQQAKETYQTALSRLFLPLIADQLKSTLVVVEPVQAKQLYGSLKAYRMLAKPTYRDSDYLIQWMTGVWKQNKTLTAPMVQSLQQHLASALTAEGVPVLIEATVLSAADTYLKNKPTSYLGLLALQNAYLSKKTELEDFHGLFGKKDKENTLPYLYTKKGFFEVYSEVIKKTAEKMLKGDWVLGPHTPQGFNDRDIDSLADEMQRLYVADYVNWWKLFLYRSQMITANDLPELTSQLQQLIAHDSPLTYFVKKVRENTKPSLSNNLANHVFNQEIATSFQEVNQFSIKNVELLKEEFTRLHRLLKQWQPFSKNKDALLDFTKKRFSEPQASDPITILFAKAEQMEPPLKQWITSVALSSWYLLIKETQTYVNEQWRDLVINEYVDNIAYRYPLNKQAMFDISLENFTHFFSPNGTLSYFFQRYLEPFIDTSEAQWKVKQVNGLRMPISDELVQQLVRAKLIRRMFFSTNEKHPEVVFSLKPIAFQPIVKYMILDIEGQKILDYQGSNKRSHFTWSGKPKGVQLVFEAINGKKSELTESGEWGWFKLLDKLNISPSTSTKHFQLIFALEGNASKYELISHDVINPFIPNVMESFDLPKTLAS